MKFFTFVKQHDSMDCGAAALKMIAKHYGKEISLDKIRKITYTGKEGVSLFAISEAAEHIGFKTLGGRLIYRKLVDGAPLPCIVHWNQEHFVVVYKIKRKNFFRRHDLIFVADPAYGKIAYDKEEFLKHWQSTKSNGEDKGVVLLLEPTKLFYNQQSDISRKSDLSFLLSYFNQYRKFFGQLLFGLLIGSVIQLIFPFLTQAIVDNGIDNKDVSFIYLVLLAQVVLIFSRTAVDFIRRWILLYISARINISLISDFFIKLMKLPMSYFDTKLTGDILQRINDHERVEKFLTVRTLETVFSFFTLIIFSVILWIYSFKIFIVFLIGSIIYTVWIFTFLRKRRILDYKYFEARAKNQNKVYQLINGMQEIKLQNSEKRRRWDWEDSQADLFNLNISSLKLEQFQTAGNIIINESKNVIITIIAALSVINNEITLGMMLATQYIVGQLSVPVEQAAAFIYELQDTKISLERINEIHLREDENKEKSILNEKLQSQDIEITNLTFQYEGPHSRKVLENINLFIPNNKITAIVGSSGSGKTTLIKLLLQYYKPTIGEIKIGEKELLQLNSTWWRNQCGAVMQDGFIFSESIAQNIATFEDEIDLDRLYYSARIANVDDFIKSLPLGYNTLIGNEGQNLSQGQKQRILIARAVYKNPDFLFFDEATNALDANNEKLIVENLQAFYKDKTVVIVAHRLSTVKNADQIVVLENGRIVEVGNHDELVKAQGAYFNLVRNQLELGN